MSMQFKPVIFVILGLSLMSLAVTSGLQQQTAMAKPKFDNSQLGQLCSMIWDAWKDADRAADAEDATDEDTELSLKYLELYAKHCGDKYGTKDLPLTDLRNNLLNDSKVPQTGGMDLLEKGMTNTKNNTDGMNVPEDGGVTKKR